MKDFKIILLNLYLFMRHFLSALLTETVQRDAFFSEKYYKNMIEQHCSF